MTKDCLLNAISLNTLPGISQSFVSKLNRLGIKNLLDLLLHLPIRYEDHTKLCPIGDALPGMIVTVQGKVINSNINFGRKSIFTCYLCDDSGIMTLRFFHFNKTMKNNLSIGKWITAYGKIRCGQHGSEIIHPKYHIINEKKKITLASALTPIYPSNEGIRQSTLRNAVDQALKLLDITPVNELLPPKFRKELISLPDALRILHRPPPEISLDEIVSGYHPAQRRLILEELLAHTLNMLSIRARIQKERALPLRNNSFFLQRFLATLPFSPTDAQKRVVAEINQDLSRNVPMMRLIQGDVGSGKTLVAALVALNAICDGWQVALMAPTELLVEQHTRNFRDWFSPLGIKVGWLAGKQKGKARQAQEEAISDGRVSMIVGTHAMFQKQVHFSRLALMIIDEQHRFGVHQRLALWKKGVSQGFHPHQLIMTATPIPRTLAMISYADLDISVIDALPSGRIPVTTVAIPETRRSEIIQRVRQACLQEKRQAYWVCTLIEESDLLEAQAAEATFQELKIALPELRIGLLHGRMKTVEKHKLMNEFNINNVQLLVATTVIEVGVDIPNASLMIIENPERLGLAQLHQLRGRIGRGVVVSYCILLYKLPLKKTAQLRLQVLRNSNDGFAIAQRDLEIRGPGELLGTRQTGNSEFRVVDLLRDQDMIPEVQNLARYIHQNYPDLASALIKRWIPKHIHYTLT
ncbi:ATP-dependent DNA helicase RecG [Candidatus Gullanella endobia]|uniref:ATP-dependent DNA helicase RecG n=1 Tax=Candidatus Gullanella endobia TaxID=1070130 RepID=A0A143WRA8_9ENTR|nr:ATP-dependent DNA helicase RecG [Candidatus Gullanella endobia]CUX96223.1 ATP-dependent DNA helicase RecG [Candidatus Gullanella endobia]